MIEKPKRPKQPSIQERQPPRTLEELVNRYDLDNTKIYDFLDELVGQLNESQITTKVIEVGEIEVASKTSIYRDIQVPQLSGYICVGVNLYFMSGIANGYCNVTATVTGGLTVYNGAGETAHPNIRLRAIYLKN